MRAGLGVAQEGADSFGRIRREHVLELASLLLDFLFVLHSEAFSKEALRQAVPADDVRGLLAATVGERNHEGPVGGEIARWLQHVMAGIDYVAVLVWSGRMRN